MGRRLRWGLHPLSLWPSSPAFVRCRGGEEGRLAGDRGWLRAPALRTPDRRCLRRRGSAFSPKGRTGGKQLAHGHESGRNQLSRFPARRPVRCYNTLGLEDCRNEKTNLGDLVPFARLRPRAEFCSAPAPRVHLPLSQVLCLGAGSPEFSPPVLGPVTFPWQSRPAWGDRACFAGCGALARMGIGRCCRRRAGCSYEDTHTHTPPSPWHWSQFGQG